MTEPVGIGSSVSFNPDEDFIERLENPDVKTFLKNPERIKIQFDETTEEGREKKRKFELEVGKAIVGLHWYDDGSVHLVDSSGEDELIETIMDIGDSGKGQLLISCEKGISNYVEELADDDSNHLPNTKTGVVIHYLIEGIARDFGITFNRAPVSLGGDRKRKGGSSIGYRYQGDDTGLPPFSKEMKNEILDKLDISYYQQDIANGKMTMEGAFKEMQETLEIKMKWEKKGWYFSPNKTEGMVLYDWKKEVSKKWENNSSVANALTIYTRNKLSVLIPNVFDNYFADNRSKKNRKYTQHLLKSSLSSYVLEDAKMYKIPNVVPEKQDGDITTEKDILDSIGYKEKGDVMGIHLVQSMESGKGKPRWVVVDVLHDGEQVLHLFCDGKKQSLTM